METGGTKTGVRRALAVFVPNNCAVASEWTWLVLQCCRLVACYPLLPLKPEGIAV